MNWTILLYLLWFTITHISSNSLLLSTLTTLNPISPCILTKCWSAPSFSVSSKVFGPLPSPRMHHALLLLITPLTWYRTLCMSSLSTNRGIMRSNKATFHLPLGSTSFLGWLPYQLASFWSLTLTNYGWWWISHLDILHPTVSLPSKALQFPSTICMISEQYSITFVLNMVPAPSLWCSSPMCHKLTNACHSISFGNSFKSSQLMASITSIETTTSAIVVQVAYGVHSWT